MPRESHVPSHLLQEMHFAMAEELLTCLRAVGLPEKEALTLQCLLMTQETCPCCRKAVNQSVIFVMFKLSRSIGRMKIKCRNEIRGCSATFPLAEQYCHSMSCVYELIPCPYQGCRAQLLRRDLDTHARHCEHWRQPCHMGCGVVLSHRTQAQHNCYRQLRQEYALRQRNHRAIAAALQRKMRRMQSTMAHMKRQIGLICESLEVMDDLQEEEVEEEVEEEEVEEDQGETSGGASASGS
ncbi:RING finger protein 151 isoform X2 [Gadus macrocephalus]|uniref:RING finger protein 151 isoform X2 n=1 Tax=Gadus macrocephalus TaxID=80720 RepID=UPI0028CB79F7|nr:RING finger protein 151 isoform X2 [Gadus macrocephalus]